MTTPANPLRFGDVLEAADQLSLEEQQELIAILHRRLAERGRRQFVRDVQESRQEFLTGGRRPVTPVELMGEITSSEGSRSGFSRTHVLF